MDGYVDKAGYMQKMGFERQSWKKRYFVLSKNEVIYYSSQTDSQKGAKYEKGRFVMDFLSRSKIKAMESGTVLADSNAVADRNIKVTLRKPNLIQIGDCAWSSDLRTFYVSCESQTERDEWLNALLKNLDVYLNTQEGKGDKDKIPDQGARRDAYNVWQEEQKKNRCPRQSKQRKRRKDSETQSHEGRTMVPSAHFMLKRNLGRIKSSRREPRN